MKVLEAEFLVSATDPTVGTGWPDEGPPEIAFAGRSNVGKSTLLQALMQRRGLVRISSTPGRTRLINFFRVVVSPKGDGQKQELRFVDLPGFGYAKVSKAERGQWMPFVARYLGGRPSLAACVILVDARREDEWRTPEGLFDETEICKYVSARGVVVLPVMTKADKLAKHERKPALARLHKALAAASVQVLPPQAVSATEGEGLDEVWRRLLVALERRGT
jgi:GTP-binding protein